MVCNACPRNCSVDRSIQTGYCGVPSDFIVGRIGLHYYEEPCISGALQGKDKRGSGTVFFSGCNLRCCYCQNHPISHLAEGKRISSQELEEAVAQLEKDGAYNINLVTPTHYSEQLVPLLERLRKRVSVPFVYNCGGYEKVETLRKLDGLIDIYMPDCKYFSPELSLKYSGAKDYFDIFTQAVTEMFRQTGPCRLDEEGMMQRGLLLRHLVLPGCRKDSEQILRKVADFLPVKDIRLSLMNQYTPEFASDCSFRSLHRKVTTFEYESVLNTAMELGYIGYFQGRSSASSEYTPQFNK